MSRAIQEKSYSQRKACALVGLEPKTFRYISTRPTMSQSGADCGTWPRTVAGSAIDVLGSCSAGKASGSTTRSSIDYTAKNG